MAEKLLFSDDSKKSSKGGLFNEPAKSSKKASSKESGNLFDSAPAKSTSKKTVKPTKTEKSADIFTDESAGSKSAKPTKKKTEKPASPKKRKKVLGIIFACLGALILLGAGVCGAIWAVWYNSDEGVLASALDNFFLSENTDIIMDGSLKAENSDVEFDISFVLEMLTRGKDSEVALAFEAEIPESRWVSGKTMYTCDDRKYETSSEARADCGWDYDYDFQSGHYEYDVTDYEMAIEAVTKGDDYYIKADFLSFINLLDLYDLDNLEDYNNQWIHITKDYLEEILESESDFDTTELQTCVENITTKYPKAAKDIYGLALKKDTGIIQLTPSSTRDNLTVYDLALSSNLDDYVAFLEDVYELPVVSATIDCYIDTIAVAIDDADTSGFASAAVNRQSVDKMYAQIVKQFKKTNKKEFKSTVEAFIPETTLTVNRSTRQIENFNMALELDGTDFVLDLDFRTNTRTSVEITTPTKSKDLEDILD